MACRLRSWIALVACAPWFAGCSGDTPAAGAAPTPQANLASKATARAVDTTAIADDAVVAAILAECHAPLRGRMTMVTAQVWLPDGTDLRLFAELPDLLRVQATSGRFLLRGDRVVRIDATTSTAPTAAEGQRVQALRRLLDAAAFGPLHRAASCRRTGPATFVVTTTGDGREVTMALRPGTLLPESFQFATGRVTVVDWLRTSTTWVARELDVDGLGRCRITFEQAGLGWDADFFRAPGSEPAKPDLADGTDSAPTVAAPAPARTRMPAPGSVATPRSPTPIVVDGKALQWACVRDPGTWPERVAAYQPLHEELVRQNQQIFGFPVFWRENGEAWLAAPFRQRTNGPEFDAPADWQLRTIPAARWLEVHPAEGDLATKLANGERMLTTALAEQGLTADGAILSQPFFHLHEGEPSATKLAAPTVRVAVRLK